MTRKQPENAEDLYARYFPLARATAARFLQGTGSDEDAEEVADDVMLKLLAHPEKYDDGGFGERGFGNDDHHRGSRPRETARHFHVSCPGNRHPRPPADIRYASGADGGHGR